MSKDELNLAVNKMKETTRESLQLLWDNINKGQQKQLIKIESIKNMFDLYGVKYGG